MFFLIVYFWFQPIPKHFQETITRPNEETVTQQNEETVTQKDEETVTHEEIVTLKDEEGGKYIVKYKYKPKSFQGGWSGFVKNHDLRVGDAVVFNQIDKFVFDVYMFRARDKSENVVCQHQCKSKCAADKVSYYLLICSFVSFFLNQRVFSPPGKVLIILFVSTDLFF